MHAKSANRVGIEIAFTVRDCRLFPHAALSCKETFSLYSSPIELTVVESADATQNLTLIDRIAADEGKFTSNERVVTNVETRYVAIDQTSTRRGVQFAIRDRGACLSVLAVKVSSYDELWNW